MRSQFKRALLRSTPHLLTDGNGKFLIRLFSGNLKKQLSGMLTDKFLEVLLGGLDLAFSLSKGFRKNIKNFEARYVFRTAENYVGATVDFKNSDMQFQPDAKNDWNVRITFKDPAALRSFIFSRDQDILNSLLKNEVEVEGNLNYIYKFGFMCRDLAHTLGVL